MQHIGLPAGSLFIFIKSLSESIIFSAVVIILISSGLFAAETHSVKPIPPRINSTPSITSGQPDTIKVLAVMVEFQTDDLETTYGDGTFNSAFWQDTSEYTYSFDLPPHNREYFQDQLLFLKNFYEDNSGGDVVLQIDNSVYPLSGAYQLPYPMWHYNHNDDDYLDQGLAELFRDSWEAASADTNLDSAFFSQFDFDHDCFIIFHAGVGKDFAFDFDPTPFDIPSAYMELEDLVNELPDIDPQGVPVSGGYHIKRGMILPETENQEGYNLGMHGHMSILFGHHLGIPNLYNSETGASGVGLFGMMDQGSGKLDGLVPAPPSTWTKVFMGWKEPVVVNSFPSDITAPLGTIFKVPISNSQYFLIENIESYVYGNVSYDSLRYKHYVDYNEYADAFTMINEYIADSVYVEWSPRGVLTDIGDWGIGRPASGLLIWHIDENVIDAKIDDNMINSDPDRRGVDLEEADGAQDIGQTYGLFSYGYGSELGSPFDAFYQGNEAFLEANPGLSSVQFSDNTFPSAKDYSGGYSHLVIDNFSSISDNMTFSVSNDLIRSGFPVTFPENNFVIPNKVFSANLDSVPDDEIFVISDSVIFAWNSYGQEIFDYNLSADILNMTAVSDFDNDEIEEIALVAGDSLFVLDYNYIDSTISTISAYRDTTIYSDICSFIIASDSLIYTTINDSIVCHRVFGNSLQFKWGTRNPPSLINHASLLPDGGLIVSALTSGDSDDWPGQFTCFDLAGNISWTVNYFEDDSLISSPMLPPFREHAVGDIDRDGEAEIVFLGRNNDINLLFSISSTEGSIEPGFPVEIPLTISPLPSGTIALADINDDGYLQIIFATDLSGIWILEHSGVISDYYPFTPNNIDRTGEEILIGENLNGEKRIFFAGTNDGYSSHLFYGIDGSAMELSGFPLSTSFGVSLDRLIQVDENSIAIAGVVDSLLYLFNTDLSDILWGSVSKDKRNSSLIETLFTPVTPSGSLMPSNMVYNWPNPNNPGENFTHIRYYLNYDASINIRIYDMAGDMVDELNDNGIGQAHNETDWDLKDISSGVYFARVEARGNGQTSVEFIKIAVIK